MQDGQNSKIRGGKNAGQSVGKVDDAALSDTLLH